MIIAKTKSVVPKKFFYARPCDEPAPGWCVAEVKIVAKRARWESTLYEPALLRLSKKDDSVGLVRMTKDQAELEAALWNERESSEVSRKKRKGNK